MWTSDRRPGWALAGTALLLAGCGQGGWCGQYDSKATSAAPGASEPGSNSTYVAPEHPAEPLTIEESDLVRLEDTWLYVMNQARGLSVLDTSTPSEPRMVARLEVLAGKGGELYLHGDSLLALVEDSGLPCHRLAPAEYAGWPSTAIALIVDRTVAPRAVVDRCVPGSLVTSRLVGDVLYVVTDGGSAASGRGWLFSLDTSDPSNLQVVESLELGGSEHQVHVTDSAIFIAEYDGASTRVRYVDISSTDGSLVERGSVIVPGLVPSRFHLDASAGTFRIVTRDPSATVTSLHVVDFTNPDQLAVLSSLTNIAPGEALFATRFVGDRAYVVTYQPEVVVNQVTVVAGRDPLWVLSLEDPHAPRILGRLEIPGWSDYVFPRGDLLLAVGRGDEGNRVAASLFDILDPTRPTELGRVEFGADRASSEATSDFRAVEIVERELGSPPLVLVPYSNNYGVGDACVPEHHLQLIDLGARELRLRANVLLEGRVLRALPVGGELYGVTNHVVASLDVSNRDAPRIDQTVPVGDPGEREACVLAPEAPRQVVTQRVTQPGVSLQDDESAGWCGCTTSGPRSPGSAVGWLLSLGFWVTARRLRGRR